METPVQEVSLLVLNLESIDETVGAAVAEDVLKSTIDELSCAEPSQSVEPHGRRQDDYDDLRARVEKSVTRFIREPDRWTSLASLLMKSMSFHVYRQKVASTTTPCGDDEAKEELAKLPIVDLPRTIYKRPYIPQLDDDVDHGVEDQRMKVSVSHQYPWVCIAQQELSEGVSLPCYFGMDVVVFTEKTNLYTPTITDFLTSYKDSFTPWEWQRIQNRSTQPPTSWLRRTRKDPRGDNEKLREFFLRWAIKEAYTKALGLGLGLDFDSFETRLRGIDEGPPEIPAEEDDTIWRSISKLSGSGCNQVSFTGTIRRVKPPSASLSASQIETGPKDTDAGESWQFIFVPLNPLGEGTKCQITACSCICRGPAAETTPVEVQTTSLKKLINRHGGESLN
mmetsp:Transcript_36346/g.86628  ORF Transcript_36346/g.86628 Transcript_36346/m.86628 type:complete len:394 (+) Transcript_36346:63-1244(+)